MSQQYMATPRYSMGQFSPNEPHSIAEGNSKPHNDVLSKRESCADMLSPRNSTAEIPEKQSPSDSISKKSTPDVTSFRSAAREAATRKSSVLDVNVQRFSVPDMQAAQAMKGSLDVRAKASGSELSIHNSFSWDNGPGPKLSAMNNSIVIPQHDRKSSVASLQPKRAPGEVQISLNRTFRWLTLAFIVTWSIFSIFCLYTAYIFENPAIQLRYIHILIIPGYLVEALFLPCMKGRLRHASKIRQAKNSASFDVEISEKKAVPVVEIEYPSQASASLERSGNDRGSMAGKLSGHLSGHVP
jgi:hypothetical protein